MDICIRDHCSKWAERWVRFKILGLNKFSELKHGLCLGCAREIPLDYVYTDPPTDIERSKWGLVEKEYLGLVV